MEQLTWNQFFVDGSTLKITTNKLIDFPGTSFSEGVSFDEILIQNKDAGIQKFGPANDRFKSQAYYYESTIQGTPGPVIVNIVDEEGTHGIMEVSFYPTE